MEYMTLKEASEKWGVSAHQINYYCVDGRIPGAVKMATIWLIPKDAEKPADRRRKKEKTTNEINEKVNLTDYRLFSIMIPASEVKS